MLVQVVVGVFVQQWVQLVLVFVFVVLWQIGGDCFGGVCVVCEVVWVCLYESEDVFYFGGFLVWGDIYQYQGVKWCWLYFVCDYQIEQVVY